MFHWGIEFFLQKKSPLGSTDAGGRVEWGYNKPIWAESKPIVEIKNLATSDLDFHALPMIQNLQHVDRLLNLILIVPPGKN